MPNTTEHGWILAKLEIQRIKNTLYISLYKFYYGNFLQLIAKNRIKSVISLKFEKLQVNISPFGILSPPYHLTIFIESISILKII